MATRRAAAEDETARTADGGKAEEEGNGGGPPIAPIEVYEDDVAGAAVDAARAALPEIRISTEMARVVAMSLDALADDPTIYQRDGRLVRVGTLPKVRGKWLTGAEGTPTLRPWTVAAIRQRLAERAIWLKFDKRARKWDPALPPEWAAEGVLDADAPPFPCLSGVLSAPTLRPDGSLLSAPGYDAATEQWLALPSGVRVCVPERVTDADARAAYRALLEPVAEFPFEAEHDRAAWVALLVTAVVRVAVRGPCPLFLLTGNASGAGKTLLADVAAIVAHGRKAARMAVAHQDDEVRKRITTIAMLGLPFVLLDNVETAGASFGSPSLDAALTGEVWQDRLLGSNEMATVPIHAVWCATGNNVAIRGDLARRVVPIRLVTDSERPEERTFRIPRLLEWTAAERWSLVEAALVLVAAYLRAGRPSVGLTSIGSFEDWSEVVRNAIVWAGADDPCTGRAALRDTADTVRANARAIVAEWHRAWGEREMTGAELAASTDVDLQTALVAVAGDRDGKRVDVRRLGPWIQRHQDEPFDGFAIRKARSNSRGSWWRVQAVTTIASTGGDPWRRNE